MGIIRDYLAILKHTYGRKKSWMVIALALVTIFPSILLYITEPVLFTILIVTWAVGWLGFLPAFIWLADHQK